ncbi:hypothetical protein ACQP00_33475 [Dactylosporangium sp. CS-047395]|uniref:hypothetical protein n=1 Tax=Dactylosporangium sp. CS-047395 TaxID=3239936 RepID=UPI003D8F50FC
MSVCVELLVFSARDGALHYTPHGAQVIGDRHPDAVAAALAGNPPDLTVLHSTSWRYAEGRVVLTYAAVLDGTPGPGARELPEHGIARSPDPRRPSPPQVCPDAVATHAARHLAWLRETDPVAGAALAAIPSVWNALDIHIPAPAGVIA